MLDGLYAGILGGSWESPEAAWARPNWNGSLGGAWAKGTILTVIYRFFEKSKSITIIFSGAVPNILLASIKSAAISVSIPSEGIKMPEPIFKEPEGDNKRGKVQVFVAVEADMRHPRPVSMFVMWGSGGDWNKWEADKVSGQLMGVVIIFMAIANENLRHFGCS